MKILILILLYGLSLFGSVGKISALNGKVIIDRQNQLLEGILGFDLEEKDLVMTDDKSKAQLTLNDGTVLSLGKNSKLDINEYVFDEKDSSNSKANFKFAEGTFKSITGAIGKVSPGKFKLETKSASIGIRGTIVVGSQEKVACTQGEITVTSAGVTQVLGAGMMTNTEQGKPPTQPKKIEGNLLKEVESDSEAKKEESKSTATNKEKTSEDKISEKSDNKKQTTSEQNNSQSTNFQATLLKDNSTQNTSIANNISAFSEVTNIANTTISETSVNKIQEELADTKKAQAIEAATSLLNEANGIVQSVALSSIKVNSASTSALSIAEGSNLSDDTQRAISTANIASTSASTLSSQAQTLKTEITTLLSQAQSANANEAVNIYEQIKTKSDLLNTISTQASNLVITAQNSLKTVSVNLSSSLLNEANGIVQSVALSSIKVNSASTSALSIAEGSNLSDDTQRAISIANIASTSASTLSSQAQTLKTEITTLLSQAQSANANEAVNIYEQIKTKSDSLNTISTQASNLVITAQNSLKTVSVNLSSSLLNEANGIVQTIISQTSSTQISANRVNQLLENASTSALAEVNTFSGNPTQSETNVNNLLTQAQILKDDISDLLLTQAQSVSASESVEIYEQIKTKSDLLNSLLNQATTISINAQTVAQNISNAFVNIPFYSASIDVLNRNDGLGSKIFIVPNGGATVTIATYGFSDSILNDEISGNKNGFDPVLILLKWDNTTSKYEYVSDSKKDDNWIVADNYYNVILNINLEEGNYKILVADYPFTIAEALKDENRGISEEGNVKIYFTSTSNLTFDMIDSVAIEKYSYITRMNNKTYINSLSYQTTSIQDGNAQFGILADSEVGTTISIKDYGVFVTISDLFDLSNLSDNNDGMPSNPDISPSLGNVFLNTEEIDDGSSWGYWTSDFTNLSSVRDFKSTWVSGNQVTPSSNYSASFSGQVIGGVTNGSNTGYIILNSHNQFNATIDLGAAAITESLIRFNDSLGNSWNGSFDANGTANVNPQGFSPNITGTVSFGESTPSSVTGSLSGKYFGTNGNVQSIGGEFSMTNGETTATGNFKARERE